MVTSAQCLLLASCPHLREAPLGGRAHPALTHTRLPQTLMLTRSLNDLPFLFFPPQARLLLLVCFQFPAETPSSPRPPAGPTPGGRLRKGGAGGRALPPGLGLPAQAWRETGLEGV